MNNKISYALKGVCRAKISGACPESLLNACALNAVEIWDMESVDSCTVSFSIFEQDAESLGILAEKCMCQAELESIIGGSRLKSFAKRHLALLISGTIILMLLFVSGLFVWDIEVYGNEKLSKGEILRTLSQCGIDCGTFWPAVDKELLRSEMILSLPELAWMTVNINSSRASVLVSERIEKPDIYVHSESADLVAKNTGIIKSISTLNGKLMVQEGNSVLEGDVLISGCMDSITSQPRLVRAQGEVIAETWYELHSVSPSEQAIKGPTGKARTRLALKFGKKRINFYLGGRKTVDGCDKIIDNYIIGIKDMFALPLSLVVEKYIPYNTKPGKISDYDAMAQRLYEGLAQGTDGEIKSHSAVSGSRDGLDFVIFRASCLENIAELSEHKALSEKTP